MPKAKPVQSENLSKASPVAPIESVEPPKVTDPCWNCGQQLQDDKCAECGFDKTLLHNLDLETERQRLDKAQNAANKA